MALKWSWAWGPETAVELETMGWAFQNNSPSYGQPITNITYTYPGSPTRYAWAQDDYYNRYTFWPPEGTFVPEGWVAVPFYPNGGSSNNIRCIEIRGNTSADSIWLQPTNVNEIWDLRIDGESKGTFTVSEKDWHYIALKYTMTTVEWGCEVFIDGVSVSSGSKAGMTAEAVGEFKFTGCIGGGRNAIYGQLIVWDALSDPGEVPRFVTRVNPTAENDETGTWTPVGAASDSLALESPFDITKYTNNSSATAGDVVSCEASGALGFVSQLGTTPSAIDGLTLHCRASGSGLNGFAGISDTGDINDPAVWKNGPQITPDINDPTYCFASASVKPSDGQLWTAASLLYVKYEVI